MITDRKIYERFLAEELAAHNLSTWKIWYKFRYPIVDYQRTLRLVEYYELCKKKWYHKPMFMLHQARLHQKGIRLGFSIGRHVFDSGLRIAHYGSIVVSAKAKIGKNCVLHNGVNIGQKRGHAPVIGERVFISPNVCLCGKITIGNNVTIGANATVTKSFPDNVVLIESPARVLKTK